MSKRRSAPSGVQLPEGHTGSSFFHHVLLEAQQAFPDVLDAAKLPSDPKRFKSDYADALVRFEAHRAASERRAEIARFLARRTQEQLRHIEGDQAQPFLEHLAQRQQAAAFETRRFEGTAGLRPAVPFEGQVYRGREVIELAERLHAEHHMTTPALNAVRWVIERAEADDGAIRLAGKRFALLGAGAELAPTPLLLAAGARVLWVDVSEPDALDAQSLAGELCLAEQARNLLTQPREIAATIERFADGEPLTVGMFAYAAGASQEWRLGASMNGIVRSLPPALVEALALFVSPTTVANVLPEDERICADKLAAHPMWQSSLHAVGLLPTPGQLAIEGATVSRSIVTLQGLSYQAAQYVSKIASAETYAVHGTRFDAHEPRPVTISANVAGITRTRSLSHPLFEAAFVGAPKFGVRIFEPPTTRALSGLLVLHDLLNPQAPGAAAQTFDNERQKVQQLLSQQVHGGIYNLPYALEPAIRCSAVIGMARKPGVLFGR
jgi:hypothetical protein